MNKEEEILGVNPIQHALSLLNTNKNTSPIKTNPKQKQKPNIAHNNSIKPSPKATTLFPIRQDSKEDVNLNAADDNDSDEKTSKVVNQTEPEKINETTAAKAPPKIEQEIKKPSPRRRRVNKTSARTETLIGQEILERSKVLVDGIKSPDQLFTGIFEQNRNSENIDARHYGREKLKTLAKRLDIPVNLHETGFLFLKL